MNMKQNVGDKDRMIRFAAGALLILWGVVAHNGVAFIGIIVLATAYFRFCPSYTLFNMNTTSETDQIEANKSDKSDKEAKKSDKERGKDRS